MIKGRLVLSACVGAFLLLAADRARAQDENGDSSAIGARFSSSPAPGDTSATAKPPLHVASIVNATMAGAQPGSLDAAIAETRHFSSGQSFAKATYLVKNLSRTWPSVSTFWCAWQAGFFLRHAIGLSAMSWAAVTKVTDLSLYSASDVFRVILLTGSLQKVPAPGDFVAYYDPKDQAAVQALETKPARKDPAKPDAYLRPFSHCGFVKGVAHGQATVVEGDVGTNPDYTKNIVMVRTFFYTAPYAYGTMKFAFARPVWQ